jgi:hypothetical protein
VTSGVKLNFIVRPGLSRRSMPEIENNQSFILQHAQEA